MIGLIIVLMIINPANMVMPIHLLMLDVTFFVQGSYLACMSRAIYG